MGGGGWPHGVMGFLLLLLNSLQIHELYYCWTVYSFMDFIFANCLVVLDMFSDRYCWCRGFTDLKYKFLSLALGFVLLNVLQSCCCFFFFFRKEFSRVFK